MKPTPRRRARARLHGAAGEALRVRVVETSGDTQNATDARVAVRLLARLLVRAATADGLANVLGTQGNALTLPEGPRPHAPHVQR